MKYTHIEKIISEVKHINALLRSSEIMDGVMTELQDDCFLFFLVPSISTRSGAYNNESCEVTRVEAELTLVSVDP